MALSKSNYVTPYGVEAQYWKIAKINIDLHYQACDIVVHGYATEDARLNGMEPLETRRVRAHWGVSEFKAFFAPDTFSSNNVSTMSVKEDKSIKPYLGETKNAKAINVELNPTDNIYERAYAFVKQDEFFCNCADII